jgi:glycosyltransferase involved in cell wall biosynthesis
MEIKMLVLSIDLDHMAHRIHYLVRFLRKRKITAKILDIAFRHETRSIFEFFKNIFLFPSNASTSSNFTIRFPSLLKIGHNKRNFTAFFHFLYAFFEFLLVKIISRSLDYNVIIATDPVSAFVASAARKQTTLFVYENLDYFEDLQSGKTRSKFISFLEKFAMKRADLVVSVSDPLARRARLLNPNSILIPNGADLKYFARSGETFREISVVYAGSIVEWAGLDLSVEAFSLLKKKFPNINMVIVGEGEEKQIIETLVARLSLQDSISFTGRLQYNQMADLLCKSCIGLAIFKPGNAAAFASPLKLFDYMAAGVPIIATDIGEIGRILKKSKAGFAIKWNAEEFVKAAESLLTDHDLWLEFHKNGLQYVEQFDWSKLFDKWLNEIQNHLESQTPNIKNTLPQ